MTAPANATPRLEQDGAVRAEVPSGGALRLHFSYHKCLTLYFQRVVEPLAREGGFAWRPFYDDSAGFRAALADPGEQLLILTDSDDVPWDSLPPHRGSHFIRDLRDLVVSGYHYHRWTREAWCIAEDFPWARYTTQPEFDWVEPDRSARPTRGSYQAYLGSLPVERGLLLEMLFRRPCIEQLRRWDFGRSSILELRYEEIVGNEASAFAALFDHYGFPAELRRRGLERVDEFRLARLAKGEQRHVRSGEAGQWRRHFTPAVTERAKEFLGDVLVRLRYERDDAW